MKQGDEVLNGLSLQFFRSVKCFIVSLLQMFTLCLTLQPSYFFNKNHPLMLHYRYLFTEIHRLKVLSSEN
jgi:hypothetical protein